MLVLTLSISDFFRLSLTSTFQDLPYHGQHRAILDKGGVEEGLQGKTEISNQLQGHKSRGNFTC
jgi:hypothetical protein